jgi:signal peptidase I
MHGGMKVKNKSMLRQYVELFAETALFVLFVNTFVAQTSQVPTPSMEDTILVGDFLFINRMAYARPFLPLERAIMPRRDAAIGDPVTFKFLKDGGKELVKRVVATEGDTVRIVDKRVFVNGKALDERYARHKDAMIIPADAARFGESGRRDNFGPIVVPPGHLFVMGDNRDHSYDSRFWGCLPVSAVRGRPWVLFFSYRAEENVHLKTGLKDKLRRWTQYFPRARWGRILHVIH